MNHYLIEVDIKIGRHIDRETLEEMFDQLAEAVVDLDGVDGDVSAVAAERSITMHLTIDGLVEEEAISRGVAAARTALHTAGWGTPGWDELRVQRAEPPRQHDDTNPRMTAV